MSISIARLFVDRQEICANFEAIISGRSQKQIMLVGAAGGMGKSWLISKFKHDCSRQSPRIAYTSTDFKDGQLHDFLSIVRTVRDDLGAAHFNRLTQAINEATRYDINIHIAPTSSPDVKTEIGDVTESEVNIAGGNIIRDNFFTLQVPNERIRADIEARLFKAFVQDLQEFLTTRTAVFFFDTYEKATETTQTWIENRLLYEIREGTLKNARVVIAGRHIPTMDASWRHCTTRPKLDVLRSEDVRSYLQEKLGLTAQEADAETLFRASQGNPQLLGMLADNILATLQPEDDW